MNNLGLGNSKCFFGNSLFIITNKVSGWLNPTKFEKGCTYKLVPTTKIKSDFNICIVFFLYFLGNNSPKKTILGLI